MITALDEADLRTALLGADVLRHAKSVDHETRERFADLANRIRVVLSQVGKGPLCFRMQIPLEAILPRPPGRDGEPRADLRLRLAPRLNEYAAMDPWTLKLAREELDRRIERAKTRCPAWDCGSERKITLEQVHRGRRVTKVPKLHVTGGRRRIAVVTRWSSREVDELAVDILGGKLIVDRLIWAGVLAGDSRKLLGRIPRWERSKPGEGRLEIAVHEVDLPSWHHHSNEDGAAVHAAPGRPA